MKRSISVLITFIMLLSVLISCDTGRETITESVDTIITDSVEETEDVAVIPKPEEGRGYEWHIEPGQVSLEILQPFSFNNQMKKYGIYAAAMGDMGICLTDHDGNLVDSGKAQAASYYEDWREGGTEHYYR